MLKAPLKLLYYKGKIQVAPFRGTQAVIREATLEDIKQWLSDRGLALPEEAK